MTLSSQARVFGLILYTIILSTSYFYHEMRNDLEVKRVSYENVSVLVRGIFELNLLTSEHLAKRKKRTLLQWKQRHASLTNFLLTMIKNNHDPLLMKVRHNLSQIRTLFFKIIVAEKLHRGRLSVTLKSQLDLISQQIVFEVSNYGAETLENLKQTEQSMKNLLNMVSIIIILILSMMFLWIKFSFLNPILRLKQHSDHLTSGKYDTELNFKGENEITDLAHSFNILAQTISNKINALTETTELLSQTNHQLEQSLTSVYAAQLRYSEVFSTALDAIMTIDAKGIITAVNPACEKMYGYLEDELIGKNIKIIVSPEHAVKHDEYIKNYHDSGVAKIIGTGRQVNGVHKDGHLIPVNLSVSKMVIDGEVFFNGVMRDIRQELKAKKEIIESNAALFKAKEEAELANKEKSRFLANMSHELRTPMHAILSFTEMTLRRVEDEKSKRFLNNIYESGERLTRLLNDLLDLSKLEAGKMILKYVDTDLVEVAQYCMSEVEALSLEKNLSMTLSTHDVLVGNFDPSLIKQVIINLLSNAIKFSQKNSDVEIQINKRQQCLNDQKQLVLSLAIIDHGIGIPENELESVFDKFIQSSKTDTNSGGTGLGLPICKEIIQAHHGKIWATSVETDDEVSTTFEFLIPVEKGND